jgi:predicted secreted protein
MVNWFTILMTYIVVWWMVLFITLPFGSSPPEQVEDGHSSGAPAKVYLGRKALATTFIAAIVTAVFFYATTGILVVPD